MTGRQRAAVADHAQAYAAERRVQQRGGRADAADVHLPGGHAGLQLRVVEALRLDLDTDLAEVAPLVADQHTGVADEVLHADADGGQVLLEWHAGGGGRRGGRAGGREDRCGAGQRGGAGE